MDFQDFKPNFHDQTFGELGAYMIVDYPRATVAMANQTFQLRCVHSRHEKN